jgi:large subunit ribosomal protein L6
MKKTEMEKEEINIPAEISCSVVANNIIMEKSGKRLERKINPKILCVFENGKIILSLKNNTREMKKDFGSAKAHLRNMIKGLTEGFEYKLEVCNVHFPMTVTYDSKNKEFVIKNLLGEKFPRKSPTYGELQVEIKMPFITIKSFDIESAGQTAATLEKISRIKDRDRNKFQDGIFITKKPKKEYI